MKKFALLGHNIAYSQSPALHHAACTELETDCEFDLVDVNAEELKTWLTTEGKTYDGFAITKPYKADVRKYLTKEMPAVTATNACNTVTVIDGKYIGTNTDGLGAVRALQTQVIPTGKNILILGAGGAARAIAHALKQVGASLYIWNRTHEKAQTLAKQCGGLALETLENMDPNALDIIIQTTTVGLNEDVSPFPPQLFLPKHVVMDIVYSPLETRFLREAAEAGAVTITGDHMLVHQAAAQVQLWHEKEVDPEALSVAFFSG